MRVSGFPRVLESFISTLGVTVKLRSRNTSAVEKQSGVSVGKKWGRSHPAVRKYWRQQKLHGSGGKWRTRTDGSPAQIGQRFRKEKRARHVVGPSVKTGSLNHKLIVPTMEGEGRKPREIKPKGHYQTEDVLAKRTTGDKIWLNPNLPENVDGIDIQKRVLTHEEKYWILKDHGTPDQEARLEAEKAELQGLTPEQVAKYHAVLDTVSNGKRWGEKEKPKEPEKETKPKPVKIGKKQRERKGMTHLERMHLLSFAQEHELDSQEVDSKLSYWENKSHLEELAKAKGISEEQLHGSEAKITEDVSAHEEYLHNLRNELESAGYTVNEPEGM